MYSSILVVGGGLKFDGACAWLKSKISLNAQQVYYGGLFCTEQIVDSILNVQY